MGGLGSLLSPSTINITDFIPVLLFGPISFLLWRHGGNGAGDAEKLNQDATLLKAEVASYFSEINQDGEFPPARSSRMLSTTERRVIFSCNADLHELKSQPGKPRTSLKLSKTETGELSFTDKKLFFVSDSKNISINMNSISSIDTYNNGITLYGGGRVRPITLVVGNGYLCADLVRNIMEGKVVGHKIKAGEELTSY